VFHRHQNQQFHPLPQISWRVDWSSNLRVEIWRPAFETGHMIHGVFWRLDCSEIWKWECRLHRQPKGLHCYRSAAVSTPIQGVTGGTDQTSGGCSLC
jgi:hypothetical protein